MISRENVRRIASKVFVITGSNKRKLPAVKTLKKMIIQDFKNRITDEKFRNLINFKNS